MLRHQEKVSRYQEDVAELTEKIRRTKMVVETATVNSLKKLPMEQTELEIDQVRAQLADYQQALDAQQTRALVISTSEARLKRENLMWFSRF